LEIVLAQGQVLLQNPVFQSVVAGLVTNGLTELSKTVVRRVRHDVAKQPKYFPPTGDTDASLARLEENGSALPYNAILWQKVVKVYFPEASALPQQPQDWEYVADRVFWASVIKSIVSELRYQDIRDLQEIPYIGGSLFFDLRSSCRSYQNDNFLYLLCVDSRSGSPSRSLSATFAAVDSLKRHNLTSFMWGDFLVLLHMTSQSTEERLSLVQQVRDVNSSLENKPTVLYMDTAELSAWLALESQGRADLFRRRLEEYKPIRGEI
jgi:hypothetical protein